MYRLYFTFYIRAIVQFYMLTFFFSLHCHFFSLHCQNSASKGLIINDIGKGRGKFENGFIFSTGKPFFPEMASGDYFFFLGKGLLIFFSWKRDPKIFFLDFLRAPPQIINGRLLMIQEFRSPLACLYRTSGRF